MKLLFIQSDVFKCLGTMILSAIIKKGGHKCDILIDSLEKDLMKEIKLINPDIICFSIVSTRLLWMNNLAKKIKAKFKKPILIGGTHPTFFPEIINGDFIDIICRGEGEYAILELLDKLEKGQEIIKIKNLWIKKECKIYKNPIRRLIEDLDSLPYADHSFYNKYLFLKNQNAEVFMTSRGCPYNCTFCFNKSYNDLYKGKGTVLRKRSVPNIIDEIKITISNNKKINYLVFSDDTFTLGPRNWFSEFFKKYKQEINLPFSVTTRVDLVDKEIIKMLKIAGCNSIRIGLESANPYLREKVLKKGIANEQIVNAVETIKNNRIKLQVYTILGIPGETLDNALETYELSYKINPDNAYCTLMQPYPGTEIMEIAQEQNLISRDFNFEELDSSFFNTIPLNINNEKEICNLQKLFQLGNVLRIPKSVMKYLIKVPQNKLFELIFKVNYAIGIRRIDNISWSYMINAAMHSRDFLIKKK